MSNVVAMQQWQVLVYSDKSIYYQLSCSINRLFYTVGIGYV